MGGLGQQETDKDGALAVGWRCFSSYLTAAEEEAVLRRGAASIASVARRHDRVIVIDIADLVDNEQNAKLAAMLRQSGVPVEHCEGMSMAEKLSAIQRASGGIFGRLHGLLLAQVFGVPSVAIGYASKLDNFAMLFQRPPVVSLQQLQDGDNQTLSNAYLGQCQDPSTWTTPVEEHAKTRAATR